MSVCTSVIFIVMTGWNQYSLTGLLGSFEQFGINALLPR